MLNFNSPYKALLGPAGSGKSYLIRQWVSEDPSCAYLASSTGIAAVNIGGNTINHALGYFDTADMLHSAYSGAIGGKLIKIARSYKNLVIEECGMFPAQQLNILVHCMEKINERIDNPLGLILVGDPGQLPPVSKNDSKDPNKQAKPFFESKFWHKFQVQELTEIKRQNNIEFIQALQLIRAGRAKETVDWFEQNVGFNYSLDRNFEGSTILPTNEAVDGFNTEALARISKPEIYYYKRSTGILKPEWNYIADKLTLKEGALVTLTSNNLEAGYANGDLGEVVDLYNTYVVVKVKRTGKIINLSEITLENKVDTKKAGEFKKIGEISFIPCRAAYATTIHRAQGLTLTALQARMDSFYSDLSGGLYTTLSRVVGPEGLRLVGTKDSFVKACYLDPRYLDWVSNIAQAA